MNDNDPRLPDDEEYVPFAQYVAHDEESKWAVKRAQEILRARPFSTTRPAWLMALLSLAGSIAALVTVLVQAPTPIWALVVGIPVIAFVYWVLATEDARILASRGFEPSAIPAPRIAVVAPWFYLLRRGSRLYLVDDKAFRPFGHHAGQVVLMLVMVFAFPNAANVGRYLLEQQ